MGLWQWLSGRPQAQSVAHLSGLREHESIGSVLDEAEAFVLGIWITQQSLVRQAIFWNAQHEASMDGFTTAAQRAAILQELVDSTKGHTYRRVFFFGESSATALDGSQLNVIVVEVGDAKTNSYGQRIYTAEDEPRQLAEQTEPLADSPFASFIR